MVQELIIFFLAKFISHKQVLVFYRRVFCDGMAENTAQNSEACQRVMDDVVRNYEQKLALFFASQGIFGKVDKDPDHPFSHYQLLASRLLFGEDCSSATSMGQGWDTPETVLQKMRAELKDTKISWIRFQVKNIKKPSLCSILVTVGPYLYFTVNDAPAWVEKMMRFDQYVRQRNPAEATHESNANVVFTEDHPLAKQLREKEHEQERLIYAQRQIWQKEDETKHESASPYELDCCAFEQRLREFFTTQGLQCKVCQPPQGFVHNSLRLADGPCAPTKSPLAIFMHILKEQDPIEDVCRLQIHVQPHAGGPVLYWNTNQECVDPYATNGAANPSPCKRARVESSTCTCASNATAA